jgi:uncharacterized membrane protein
MIKILLAFLSLAISLVCGITMCLSDTRHFLSYHAMGLMGATYGFFLWMSLLIAVSSDRRAGEP